MFQPNESAMLNITSSFYLSLSEEDKFELLKTVDEIGVSSTALWIDSNEVNTFFNVNFITQDKFQDIDHQIRETHTFIIITDELNVIQKLTHDSFLLYLDLDNDKLDWIEELSVLKEKIIIVRFKKFEINEANLYKYNNLCTKLNELEHVFLSKENWRTATIKQHPCNIYACSGKYCHSKKSKIPRDLYIDQYGNLFPSGINEQNFMFGNIKEKKLTELLEETNNFTSVCSNIFRDIVIDYPYDYFPIDSFVFREGESNEVVETNNFNYQ
ncbi:hypothetical protein [Culicoidibacter larvae]|uniref:Uncharacterized protein n=1 Tax=Culicoidibacter larvae TaxID=2579976 RepID=A0A5R8Q6K9_9FIRM|nr:hypothetical protein [Culicoidibacter larvae]TLG70302.1 hypothetical protein FEZ08_11850 [Culicoidibacter larvae]